MLEELIESNRHWILIISIPGALVFAALMIYLMRHMSRKKLEPLALALGGEMITSFWKGTYIRLLNYGAEIRIIITPGGQNSPPFLVIEQSVPLGFDLSVSKENIATRKLEEWGLLKEIKTGDPVFDDSYFIRSNDQVRTQNFLMDSNRRAAINHFFDKGFSEIHAAKDSVKIRKAGYSNEDLDPELFHSHLEKLQKLISE